MKFFWYKRRSGAVWIPIVTGLAGVFVGAVVVSMFTPKTGPELRELVRELIRRGRGSIESDESQLDRMAGEGGYGQGPDERAY